MSNIKTQRIPLVGSLINRNANPSSGGFLAKDQQFTNCYPEIVKNTISGDSLAYLYKRQGCTLGSSVVAGALGAAGCCVWTGNTATTPPVVFSFVLAGNNIGVFDTTLTQIGSGFTATDCTSITETIIGTTSNLVGYFPINSGPIQAWFFPQGGAWTQITDADFPPNIGTPEPIAFGSGPVHMDGYMFVMTKNGKIWNSDLNSVANWTASSFITDSSYPDGGVGIARYKNLIVAFGTSSISFYQNLGNTPLSPLAIIPSATIRMGAYNYIGSGAVSPGNGVTILPVGDTVYFIGTSSEAGALGVYRLNGYAAEKVSTPYVDKIINDPSVSFGTFKGFSGVIVMHGMRHLVMNIGFGGAIANFCIDTGVWWIPANDQSTIVAAAGLSNNSYYTTGSGSGAPDRIRRLIATASTDGGVAYTQTVQTENMDMGTMRRKSWLAARVVGDIQSATSNIGISWSDDDYATFSTPVNIDMSSLADMGSGISRLGQSRRRAWKLTHSANTPNRMEALELTYSIDED